MDKIAVFPAAGKLGTSIYSHLSRMVDPAQLILITRKPENLSKKYGGSGAIIRSADYDAPDTLGLAFEGARYLVLISYPSLELEHRVQAHKSAIDAALDSGVRHIFYTSLAFGGDCTPHSVAYVMQAHLQTEEYLRTIAASQTDFKYTAVREGLYSESSPMYTGFPDFSKSENAITLRVPHPGTGSGIAWVAIDDLGEATARLVVNFARGKEVQRFENRIVLLSGPQEWSIMDSAETLANALDKGARFQNVTVEEYIGEPKVQEFLGSHGDGDVPSKWATSFEAVKQGETCVTSDLLERLLNRKAKGFEETVKQMVMDAQGES